MEIRFDNGWSWERIESEIKGKENLSFEVSVSSPLAVFFPVFSLILWTRDRKEVLKVGFHPYDCMASDAIQFVIDKMTRFSS